MRYVVWFLIGLVVTPVLTWLLGWILFGHRSTWDVGQGDSFLVFFVSLWTTPIGAFYWPLVVGVGGALEDRVPPRRLLLGAGCLYAIGIVTALLLADRAYG